MAEESVIIPIVLDVQDDGETANVTDKLARLRDTLKDIDNVRRTSSGKLAGRDGGIPDWKRVDRARSSIESYIKSFKKLDTSEAVKSAEEYTRAINQQIDTINEVIARNKALQPILERDKKYTNATAQNDMYLSQIKSVEDLQKYYEALEQKIYDVDKLLREDPAKHVGTEEVANNIRNQVQAIDELVYSLGELANEWSEVSTEYENAYSLLYAMHSKEGIFAGGVSDKDLADANQRYEEIKEWNELLQEEAVATANRTVSEIGKQIVALDEEIRKYQKLNDTVSETGKIKYQAAKSPMIKGAKFNTKPDSSVEVEAEKAAKKATEAQIKALNDEAAAVRKSVSQYYYKLRSVKMLHFAINNISTALKSFGKNSLNVATKSLSAYLKLVPGVARLQKAISQSSTSQKKFNAGLKTSTKEAGKLNFSIKDTIKNLLKYGLGIRSLFVLFNKLRSAVISGFNDMAKIYDPVNKQLSSIASSLTQLRNAASAAVEPLLSVLAPALERIANLATEVAYKVASFIAALTGRSMVIRATRAQTDYAKSLDKTGKSAKKAKNELAAFDDLDVLNKHDDGGGDEGIGAMFDEVPIDETMKNWAEKFKEFLDKLFNPIKDAWDRAKAYVANSFKYMCQQLKALWADVARDFWRVWEEFTTEQMFYFLFLALGDIMMTIGSIAKKIREAWNYAENGYRILKAIRDMAYDAVVHFRHMTAATRDWAESTLNLKPLFTAVADVMERKVEPAFDRILNLIEMLYNNAILDLARDFINTNLPVIVRGIGEIAEGIGLIARRIQTALETGTKVDKKLTYTRSRLQQILDKVEHFAHLASETFKKLGEDFKKWADGLDFRPLVTAFINLLTDLQPLFEALFGYYDIIDGHMEHVDGIINKLWNETILPFWKYLIEDGGPRLIELLGKIFGEYDEETGLGIDWEKLTQNIGTFIETLEPFFELAWEVLLQIIEDLGKAFDDFVNSGTLETIVNGFKDWVDNADPEDLAHKIETFAGILTGLIGAFSLVNGVFLPFLENWMSFHNFLNNVNMAKQLEEIAGKIDALKNPTSESASAIGELVTESGKVEGNFDALPGLFSDTALALADVAGAVADIFLAVEVDKLKKIDELINALPQTTSDLNGLNIEMDKFQKLLKFMYELWTGETILDHFIVQSDYEKLETMTQKLNTMGQEMESDGKLSSEMAQKVEDAFAILGDNIDSVENLTDEQVQAFSELYKEVEDYYNVVEDKVPKIKILWDTFLDIFRDPESIMDNFIHNLNSASDETVHLKDVIGSFPEVMGGTFDFWKERLGYVKYETEETKTATEELGNAATEAASTATTAADTAKTKAEEVKHPIRDIISNIFGAKSATEELTETTETGTHSQQTAYENLSVIVGETGTLINDTATSANAAMSESQQNATSYKDSTVSALNSIQSKFSDVALNFTDFTKSIQITLDGITSLIDTWYQDMIAKYFGYDAWSTALQEGMLLAITDFFTTTFVTEWDAMMQTWWTEGVVVWFTVDKWQAEVFEPMSTMLQTSWTSLMKWWDESMKNWWDNKVIVWFKEDKWLPEFMHIYIVAEKVFKLIEEIIREKMSAAKDFCIECCDAMAESIHNVIDLIDELIDKLGQLEGMSGNINVSFAGNVPHLAKGAVIPPNKEFMAVLGDQTSGTNIETPLETMLDAFRSVMEEYGGARGPQNAIMEVDGETFARLMMPHVMDEMHRLGYNTEIIEGM